MSEKPFLMVLGPIWSKIVFKKIKLPNLPKNTENPRFFEFPKVIKWPELEDNYPKTSAFPQSLASNFFGVIKIFPKNHPPPPKKKGAFFLERGLLNVVFASFDAA